MIIISGASGDLGTRIANKIAEIGDPKAFRLTSRSPKKLAKLAAKGFETEAFDFDNPDSMRHAMKGCETVLIISGDAPVEPRITQHRAAINAAKDSGVKHIVYTSFVNPAVESRFPFAAIHEDTEAVIKGSGLDYTILRSPMYAENIMSALRHAKETGHLSIPGSEGKVTYLSKDDIAEIIARVLVAKPAGKNTYDLTNTEAWTLAELAVIASEKWGRDVTASEMSYDDFGGMLLGFGLPPFLVEALKGIHKACGAGEYSQTTDDAEILLGRKPAHISEFIAAISA